ncbi:MAG: formate dehydrogenase accessory protein FdhE [Vicinamibacterales bacterium]
MHGHAVARCTIAGVEHPHHHPRGTRTEPREIVELRQLRATQPDLATAVDFQIALLQLQHRIQSRLAMPWFEVDPGWLREQQGKGRPFLRFEDIPLDWTDVRLMFRQTADLLLRHEALDPATHGRLQSLAREGHTLEPLVVGWYNQRAAPEKVQPGDVPAGVLRGVDADTLDQVVTLALRPFLERCAEVLQQRLDFSAWTQAYCPICGGAPEFAVITRAADRMLLCSRCSGRWSFHPLACPYCHNDDRSLITSFASRDGHYRLYACDVCRRYVKAYDARRAARPVMLAVDSIATLPLDAAAIQRGYKG